MEVTALRESFHSHFHSQCQVTKDKFHLPPIFRNVRSKNSKIQTKRLIPSLQPHGDTNQCWSHCQLSSLLLAGARQSLLPIGRKYIKVLLLLIRHLRGLRGFNLTFSTFYRVSSLAQRNLESHKNAGYDISMTVHAQLRPRRGERCLTQTRELEMLNSNIPKSRHDTFYCELSSCLLRHKLTFSV